jgi:ABC-type transport system substrate-binding protein
LPAHFKLADGRWLAAVPAAEWPELDEERRGRVGVGPYVLREWKYGERMAFAANPFYYRGQPATPNLIVRFIPQDDTAQALLAGQMNVLA